MGLTGERGAQAEGKADTQHHYRITVDAFVSMHRSPTKKTHKRGEKRKEFRWKRKYNVCYIT